MEATRCGPSVVPALPRSHTASRASCHWIRGIMNRYYEATKPIHFSFLRNLVIRPSSGPGTLRCNTTHRHTNSVERQLYMMSIVPLRLAGEYQPSRVVLVLLDVAGVIAASERYDWCCRCIRDKEIIAEERFRRQHYKNNNTRGAAKALSSKSTTNRVRI